MEQQAEQPAAPALPRIGKQGDPCVMAIFGAAGDLTARKLIPALYNLARAGLLSREFAVVGVAPAKVTEVGLPKKGHETGKKKCSHCREDTLWESVTQPRSHLA